jgi:hypothetical protein
MKPRSTNDKWSSFFTFVFVGKKEEKECLVTLHKYFEGKKNPQLIWLIKILFFSNRWKFEFLGRKFFENKILVNESLFKYSP